MIRRALNQSGVCAVRLFTILFLFLAFLVVSGCGVFNVGKWKGIEHTSSDENFFLVKDIFLTAGSVYSRKDSFDHNINESVNVFFIPRDERNRYVAETRWFDPMGQEYRTVRTTYDVQQERKAGEEREKKGTTRIHSMSTKELVNHKAGMWKVELFLDGKLVRRLSFSVR